MGVKKGDDVLVAVPRFCVGVGVTFLLLCTVGVGVVLAATGLPAFRCTRLRTSWPENKSSNRLTRISKESIPALVSRIRRSCGGCDIGGI